MLNITERQCVWTMHRCALPNRRALLLIFVKKSSISILELRFGSYQRWSILLKQVLVLELVLDLSTPFLLELEWDFFVLAYWFWYWYWKSWSFRYWYWYWLSIIGFSNTNNLIVKHRYWYWKWYLCCRILLLLVLELDFCRTQLLGLILVLEI